MFARAEMGALGDSYTHREPLYNRGIVSHNEFIPAPERVLQRQKRIITQGTRRSSRGILSGRTASNMRHDDAGWCLP
jgi:hypothetical protein